MPIPFYDNQPLELGDDGWVDIDRIYCFDWDAFDRGLMDRLRGVFRELPQSRIDLDGNQWWYSDREDIERGYLAADMEPPGLQVYGTLPLASWEEWDREFQARAAGLPVRDLG